MLPALVVQDTWLAFVDGREVAAHGPPHVDTHALWSHGVEWTDQQWLAHAALYALAHAGGVRLALIAAFVVTAAATVASAIVARRLGGSAVTTALILPLPSSSHRGSCRFAPCPRSRSSPERRSRCSRRRTASTSSATTG